MTGEDPHTRPPLRRLCRHLLSITWRRLRIDPSLHSDPHPAGNTGPAAVDHNGLLVVDVRVQDLGGHESDPPDGAIVRLGLDLADPVDASFAIVETHLPDDADTFPLGNGCQSMQLTDDGWCLRDDESE